MFRIRRFLSVIGCAVLTTALATAQAPATPQPTCITNVSLGLPDDDGGEPTKVHVVLRYGRIDEILSADAPIPSGVRIVDGEGLIGLPAFIDAYTRTGVETPEPAIDQDIPVDVGASVRIDMREANRKGIEPAFRAAEALAIDADASRAWRENGFGAAHVAPGGQLLAGTTCVASTREAAMRDVVLRPDAFAAAAFQASGPGYPGTLMGYMAQLRQFFLDAARHAELAARYEAGRPGLRPPFDAELEAGGDVLAGKRVLLCETGSHRDIERWIGLADELEFAIAISGGKDAWRAADRLAERDIPVYLTLDWGKEVKDPLAKDKKKKGKDKEEDTEEAIDAEDPDAGDAEAVEASAAPDAETTDDDAAGEEEAEEAERDWQYKEPLGVRVERRRRWEETRDSALRLTEAGVRFAFGTGTEKPGKLLEKVRTLVETGLAEDAALAALTTHAAELLGLDKRLGRIEPGYDATLALWSADPLTDKKAKVVWVFVDGFPTEFDLPDEADEEAGEGPAEGVDASGTWTLTIAGDDGEAQEATLTIEMAEDGAVTGKHESKNPRDDSNMTIDVTGTVNGTSLKLSGSFEMGDFAVDFTYAMKLEGDSLSGDVTYEIPVMSEPIVRTVDGERDPKSAR